VLGHHRGHHRFTVGQRRGIGVAGPEPLFVLSKDAARNRVVVGPRSELTTELISMRPGALHRDGWRAGSVRLRYHSPAVACALEGDPVAGPQRSMRARLGQAVAAAAPGQTACLMDGDLVVGWGTLQDAQDSGRSV
jgi:tRNA-specific 2-thiouridylase